MNPTIFSLQILIIACAQFPRIRAADVRSWRNDGNGLYPAAQAETDWAAASHVKWETPVPAQGNGCPILGGDVIFVGAEDGNAAFVKPGRTFGEISRTKVPPYRSTPIFEGLLTYLRTHEKLLAIHSK